MLQRHLVKRCIYVLRRRKDAVTKKAVARQRHARLMTYPGYRCKCETIDFLRNTPMMWSFIELAAAHYNTQIDRGLGEYYIKPDFDSKLDIAANYFIRDRAGLVEWWCMFTQDGREFLGEEGAIKYDLGIPFHAVFADVCLKKYGIEVRPDPDEHRKVIRWPCMTIDKVPNMELMTEVASRAGVKIFEDWRQLKNCQSFSARRTINKSTSHLNHTTSIHL